MHSVSDLTTFARKTTGDVPPTLVGASTTVVGAKMYLFGGRLVTERQMVSDLYVFDLESFVWSKLPPADDDDVPGARYFHSTDTWNNHLIVFGGMGQKPGSTSPEDLCVLNDIRFFDLTTHRWLPSSLTSPSPPSPSSSTDPNPTPTPKSTLIPGARYAHLSSITSDRLFIIGGQDLLNLWLDDVYVYDLNSKSWIQHRDFPRHCGAYRSVAVSANMRVRLPQVELRASAPNMSPLGPPGTRFRVENVPPSEPECTASDSLIHLPYSTRPSDDFPNDILLYSNYNFTDVKRELEVFTPLPDGDFSITDRSNAMTGSGLPPGLRFPTGAILGTHLIIAGTYLAHTYQSFSIWALDLLSMTWSRIDPGSTLSSGSWARGCLWPEANKFLIFGNRNGNLVEDYNRRLLSWDHVACIDLEAFGIYQPPALALDPTAQELGLAALEEGVLADFEVICDDGRRVKCSRKLLEDRWQWFREQRQIFLEAAAKALETLPASAAHVPLPDAPGFVDPEEPIVRPDPRLAPRSFKLSEPYPITLALLQYLYSLALITPLQHAPAVLSQLLLLSSTYKLTHLESLVKHAMHRALSSSTSVGVYEVATLCGCQSLQIRALKAVMSSNQKRPGGRTRSDRSNGEGRDGGGGGNSNGNGAGSGVSAYIGTARPRGMSDAVFRSPSDQQSGGGGASGYGRSLENKSNGTTYDNDNVLLVSSDIASQTEPAVSELLSPGLAENRYTNTSTKDDFDQLNDDTTFSDLEPESSVCKVTCRLTPPGAPLTLLDYRSAPRRRPISIGSYSESETEQESQTDRVQPPQFTAFHLPRRIHAVNSNGTTASDSDTPSLTSSPSYSSLSALSSLSGQSSPVGMDIKPLSSPTEYHHSVIVPLAAIEELVQEESKVSTTSLNLDESSGTTSTDAPLATPTSPYLSLTPLSPSASSTFLPRRPRTISQTSSDGSSSPLRRFLVPGQHNSAVSKAEKEAAKARAKAAKLEKQAQEMDRAAYEAALRDRLNVSKAAEQKQKRDVEKQQAKIAAEVRKREKQKERAARERERAQFTYLGGML